MSHLHLHAGVASLREVISFQGDCFTQSERAYNANSYLWAEIKRAGNSCS